MAEIFYRHIFDTKYKFEMVILAYYGKWESDDLAITAFWLKSDNFLKLLTLWIWTPKKVHCFPNT
jgi:hypothetical protein